MLVASEVKGELARIVPARACCRRAELAGLLWADRTMGGVSTFDHATARIAVQLATLVGVQVSGPHPVAHAAGTTHPARTARAAGGRSRHHLVVGLDESSIGSWTWGTAPACDRRAFLRGVLLGGGSISLAANGPHVEFVFRDRERAAELLARLAANDVHGGLLERRGRWVAYLKGREEIATLLQLTGANRGLLDFETSRVGRDVQNRLNRLLNAEEANLARTVRAADRQLQAIAALDRSGRLGTLAEGLRAAATERRLQPEADLDTLSVALGVSRSATNYRLRRLVELAEGDEHDRAATREPKRRAAS
jgi:DNA-binding transcriptional regulator WhiA